MSEFNKYFERFNSSIARLPDRKPTPEQIRTSEDIELEDKRYRAALELGINLRMTDGYGYGEEDPYELDKTLALLYIMKDEQVPEELRERLLKAQGEQRESKVFKIERRNQ